MECAFLSLSVDFQLMNKLTTDSWKLALLIQILKFYFNIGRWIHMYVCVYVDSFFFLYTWSGETITRATKLLEICSSPSRYFAVEK